MATILCVTDTMPGLFYPALELARRLRLAGHRVVYMTDDEGRDLVAAQGVDFLPLEPGDYAAFLARDAERSWIPRLLDLETRRRDALRSHRLEGFLESVDSAEPDLILLGGEMHEQVLAVANRGAPVALLNSFISIWRRPGLPPSHHLVRPGHGWRGSRPGIALLWLLLRCRKWGRAWRERLRRVGCDRVSLLRLLADRSGLDFDRETDRSQWLMPFTYRSLPSLTLHALEFEFPHQPPAVAHYVGPMQLEGRGADPTSETTRSALDALLERVRSAGSTLIYAAFGSFFTTDHDFLRRLAAAVAERSDWELVISLGGRVDPEEIGPLPDGVHAFGWLPQLELLQKADVAVVHGGINTVDECVLAGVPMLVYCGFETDMGGTTARVVDHGLGIAGDRAGDDAESIRGRLDELLSQPSYRRNVERMRTAYHAYAQDQVAERLVESMLDRTPESRR